MQRQLSSRFLLRSTPWRPYDEPERIRWTSHMLRRSRWTLSNSVSIPSFPFTRPHTSVFASNSARHFISLLPQHDESSADVLEPTSATIAEAVDGLSESIRTSTSPTSDPDEFPYLYDLKKWYRDMHDVSLKDAFVSEGTKQKDNSWLWTSTFVCPILGERVNAGRLPGVKIVSINRRAYYGKKKVAMQAAAMEAYCRLANEMKFHEKAVRTELDAWYLKHHGVSVREGVFEFRSQGISKGGEHAQWWTSSFTCPVSGEIYHGGTLKNAEEVFHDPDDSLSWYRKKSEAVTAVASRVLDLQRFQSTGVSDPRYCEEDPSVNKQLSAAMEATIAKIGEDDQLPSVDDVLVEDKTTILDDTEDFSVQKILEEDVACKDLSNFYQHKHSIQVEEESFIATTAMLNCQGVTDTWWTASFICPVSGVRFNSGTLRDMDPEMHHTDSENVVWYKEKSEAIRAVASRTLDSVRSLESDVWKPRHCEEDPSPSLHLGIESFEESKLGHDMDDEVSLVESQDDVPSVSPTSNSQPDMREKMKDTGRDDVISQRRMTRPLASYNSTPQTTLGLIAETWTKSSNRTEVEERVNSGGRNRVLERQRAIDAALEWVERRRAEHEQKSRRQVLFDLDHRNVSLQIGNLMLDSLAKSHFGLPFESKTIGLEAAATSIVDIMWSSKTAKPSANTYASYLLCLEGDNPLSIARRGELLLQAMTEGVEYNGRILPRPNIDVINSVVRLFARVGGSSGRVDFPRSTIQPNRDTFLSMLSSIAYPATIDGEESEFDSVYARDCIQRMRSHYDNTNDDSFLPNTMVFNAPLRWSGGLVSMDARPYAQPLAWDRYYEDVFRDGFKSLPSDNRLLIAAEAMESWLCDMEISDGVCRPNLETFESLIQAWIRTGSLHGLKKAEALANRVFDPSADLQPRAQTLHPILSAWIYSGAKDGAAKVVEWVDRFFDATNAKMDGRLLGAKLLADVSFQRRQLGLMKQTASGASSDSTAESGIMLERAQSCSRHLQCLNHNLKERKEQFYLEADSFLLAIQAWRNAASINMEEEGSSALLETIFSEVFVIAESYDDMLVSLSFDDQIKSDYVLYLMMCRTRVYSAALAVLNDYCRNDISIRSDTRWQQMIERAFRTPQEVGINLDEYQATNGKDANSSYFIEQQMPYDDQFSYPSAQLLHDSLAETQIDLVYQVLGYHEKGNFTATDDDRLVELCVLVTEKLRKDEIVVSEKCQSLLQLLDRLLNARIGAKESLINQVLLDLKAIVKEGGRGIKEASEVKPFKLTKSRARSGKRRGRARWSHKATAKPRARRSSVA